MFKRAISTANNDKIAMALLNAKNKPKGIATRFIDSLGWMAGGVSNLLSHTSYTSKLWMKSREGTKISLRSDIRHIMRFKNDLRMFFPALTYLIMPFTTYTYPSIIRRYPDLIPSVFVTSAMLEAKMLSISNYRASLKIDLISKFTKEIKKIAENSPNSKDIQFASEIWKRLLKSDRILHQDIIQLLPLFQTLNIKNIDNEITTRLCKYLSIPKSRPDLLVWIDWIIKDDVLLSNDGVSSSSKFELYEALCERGFIDELLLENTDALSKTLSCHVKFTQGLIQSCKKRRVVKNDGAINGAFVLNSEELCAIMPLLVIARLLNVVQ